MTTEQRLADSINADISIKQISINGYQINYAVAGCGNPLLLLHGANIGWGQWYCNIGELSRHFTVYAIDLPGAGLSTKLDFRRANFQKDFVDTISKFIMIKELKRTNVVGHSIGGWIATQLALQNKHLVCALVLVDSLGFTHQIQHRDRLVAFYPFAKLLSTRIFPPTPQHMRQFLESVMQNPSALDQKLVDYLAENVRMNNMRHPFLFIHRLVTPFGIRKEFILKKDELSAINQRTLIIMGDKDPLVSTKNLMERSAYLPNARIEIFHNTGHVPSIEKPQMFNKVAMRFLTA